MAARKKKNLVIVESPAKARTINKYLGNDFEVVACKGHIRDLPKSRFGIDIENGWVPTYRALVDRKDVLTSLKKQASAANAVFLAPDPDREGEAIAWHLKEALGLSDKKAHRVTFNEITKTAVQKAFAEPTDINMDLVAAQEARRFLDRVVGYRLSPLLSRTLAQHLSAGRVQSVAVRLIVEREREIQKFKPEEYWKIAALLAGEGIESSVLDLRTLAPLDKAAVLAVARHCSRVLIVHEDTRTGGIGESLAAIIQEEAFDWLDAPVRVIGALDTPVPYSPPLEEAFLPSEDEIYRAAMRLVAY